MIQVTAITAAYNAASYIENCIQSVLAQTVPCRMVIVDDASRDDTYAIAMRYAEEYPDRITVLKNEQNAGAAASRNRAVACVTTPYVAILDADDWWQEDKTERQLKRLAETKADACYAGRELMYADGTSTTKIVQVPETVTYHGLLKGNVIPCSSVLMCREDALQYPMTHDELHEDYIVWLSMLRDGKTFAGVNEPLLKSRLGETGKSRKKGKSARMTYGVYRYMGIPVWKAVYYFCCYAAAGCKKYAGARGKKVKILIDARTLGKRPSGVGMYLYNFICGLMQYDTMKMELLTDVVESAAMKELDEAHIPIHRYGTPVEKSIGVYAYFRFVQNKINEVKPDLFWEVNNLTPVVIRNPYGKTAVTVHDVFPITAPYGYGRLYPYYFKWNLGKTLRHMDAVIYNSLDTKTQVEQYYPAAKALPSCISYIITEERPSLPVCDEGYFLYIGNLEERKGTDLLLKAYVRYRKDGGTKKLYLAGKIRSDAIETLLGECQKETDGVCYQGYLETEEKYRMYAACSAFLFPSRAEGFGMPVIEALTYRKPVLVSDLPIFHEIAGDAVRYCKLDTEDAVPQLAAAMRQIEEDGKESIPESLCEAVVGRYKKERLAGGLKEFLETIGKK